MESLIVRNRFGLSFNAFRYDRVPSAARHPLRNLFFPTPPIWAERPEPMTDLAFFGTSFAAGFVIFFGMIV